MPLSDLKPLALDAMRQRRSMSEIVADVLRRAIITGVLRAGEELNQVELSRQFGVSRVPIREAIRMLEAEGLVVSEMHRRTLVSPLAPDLLHEMFEVRAVLECMLLEAAIPNLKPADLDRLDAVVAEMEATEDHQRWLELNEQLHAGLLRRSGKEYFLTILAQVRRDVSRHLWMARRSVKRNREADREHRELLAACRAGDAGAAVRLMREHLANTLAGLKASLRRVRESPGSERG
ncbi:MAG TPA: GntR family transcriptional regulator [Bacillota bacterium]